MKFSIEAFLNGLFEQKLGGQSKDQLTAELILENPDRFHPNAVKWARVMTNVATFLRAQTLDKDQPALAKTDTYFSIVQSGAKPISKASFLAGGICNFTYIDDQEYRDEPLNGKLTVGVTHADGAEYTPQTAHPYVALELDESDFGRLHYFFHYDGKSWKTIIEGGEELSDDHDGYEYTPPQFRNLCLAIASPFKAFLGDLGVPAWNRPGPPKSTPKLS